MKDNAASTHQRSPNYPANSLVESIGDVQKLFETEKRTVLSPESVVKAIGYGSLNGASRTKLASLRKYGLIDQIGDGMQVSHLAIRIIHSPPNSPDYLAAVQEAAMRPESFKQFHQTHREASEQSIISELIVKRGYSPEGAKLFARSFRETIIFAKLDEEGYSPSGETDKNKAESTKPTPPPSNQMQIAKAGEFTMPMAAGIACVPFPMSDEEFELLMGTLNLWKKKLVGVINPKREYPADALWKNNDFDKPVKIVGEMGERNGQKYFQSEDGTGIPGSELWFNA